MSACDRLNFLGKQRRRDPQSLTHYLLKDRVSSGKLWITTYTRRSVCNNVHRPQHGQIIFANEDPGLGLRHDEGYNIFMHCAQCSCNGGGLFTFHVDLRPLPVGMPGSLAGVDCFF